ncbi:hypothetical protein UF75_2110 [Desulfosporosinus sp. I2]|uniref:AAA family ATPase n=1 Tax=Desulfosporosinus sp. I2 TaxID=1617025 RepID=UPI0005EDE998|nr:AAA family ATPase [Desulfosporosinus sp. I2]KJR47532.1 hypothetical protein UF75_2110 [Desulfosporosinus sp. I2]
MFKRIHILGASASGTTTLAKALSKKTGYCHFDTDDYYWIPTDVPFTQKRNIEERQELLKIDLGNTSEWILSGSLCGWGDIFIPHFELVVYLSLPKEIRIKRLIGRERQRYGTEIEQNGERYQLHNDFVEWASQYDEAGTHMRSKALHDMWLSKLPCSVLKIEGDKTVEERLNIVHRRLK